MAFRRFTTEAEALQEANSSDKGLAAFFFSRYLKEQLLAFRRFSTEAEALQEANSSDKGLAAFSYSR